MRDVPTQGIVSVVVGGKVVMKFISGVNGHKARDLSLILEERKGVLPTLAEGYELACRLGFGSRSCLVVMDKDGEKYEGEGGVDSLSPLYREEFDNPNFNPRWPEGKADYVFIVYF